MLKRGLYFSFVLVIFFLPQPSLAQLDYKILRQTNLHRNKNLDAFFVNTSNAISYTTAGTPLVLYGIGLIKNDSAMKKKAVAIAISAGINGAFTYAIKHTVNRPRPAVTYPQLDPLQPLTQYSFPSGHTSSAFNTATSLVLQYPSWKVAVPAYVYAATMSYSRLHLGVHYASDVAAGAALGAGSAWLSHKATAWLQKGKLGSKYKKIYTWQP